MTNSRLCAGHAAFDETLVDLVARAQRGDWHGLDAAWEAFANDVADHLHYEEREIFDDYEDESPANADIAAELRADHAALRDLLGQLAAEIEERCIRGETVEVFVGRLRVHADREDATVYVWLEQRRGTQHRHDRAAV
jgi:hemerythrin-like domain-containing protein